MSMVSLAAEYSREVQASEILKQIENGDDVNLTDCRIIGELDLSEIELQTVPNPRYNESLEFGAFNEEKWRYYGGNKDLKVVESNIKIHNSIFENDLDFSNALFKKSFFFVDVNCSSTANCISTNFSDSATFVGATFGDSAFFDEATFTDTVDFLGTQFKEVTLNNTDFEEMRVSWDSLENSLVFDGLTYVKLVRNFRNLEQFGDADAAYFQYRKHRQAEKPWILFQTEWPWISFPKWGDIFMRLTCGYGVKPFRAFGLGGGIVLLFSLLYWGGNGISRLKEEKDNMTENNEGEIQKTTFSDAFYFSMVTFATIGYGDWYPIEGFLGWLTLGLFLVTLMNVTIRP
ncbi:potassium channel family protein [Methanosarcina sp. WH1]|uniref:potassium channel family protein n=1 Tax=Methanosarcina sp. WH1 TaxID=1434102 RepID=UPI00061601C1|nr:potassium channel family protein [Methanosarcina sp. WH1]AKB23395.1 hypothetical protein MSWH1_3124 [Methanosarcina sp. WH1]